MRRILLTLLLSLPVSAGAQTLDPNDYIYPLRGVQGYYSANFGEMRPNHFHSGVDIKTDGAEGKEVVAVADGFVSRIVVNPAGFGRALYLTLRNGTTAVYGHLSRFRDDIETYVYTEQTRRKRNRVDLTPEPGQFPVVQGDRIARSGNSGMSFGPHLHFELRDQTAQRTLNLVRQGIVRPIDDIPPYILSIHYIETDTVRGVPVHRKPASYDAAKTDPHTFRLTRHDPVEIGTNGYLVVETTDRRNHVANTFGIYRATLFIDGIPHFEYRMDGFTFDRSRDCNAAAYYPMQLTSRNQVLRMAAVEGACTAFCPVCRDRGTIAAAPGETHTVRIEVEDDCGNLSHLVFTVRGRAPWHAAADPGAEICDRRRTTVLAGGEARISIPAGALYESLLLHVGRTAHQPPHNPGLCILSPVYRLLDWSVPLKKAVEVSIAADVPDSLQACAALGVLTCGGRIRHAGGHYHDGRITARTTSTGGMLVVADTVPPVVKPLFTPGADLSHARSLSFRIADDFSGIASCELSIDGEWALCDRLPVKNTATHLLRTKPSGKRHTVHLTVCDGCGNRTVWQGTFVR